MSIQPIQPRLALALATTISLALATALSACRNDDTIRETGNSSLEPPPAFEANVKNVGQIDLSWRVVAGADYYRIYRLDPSKAPDVDTKTAAGGVEIACGAFSVDDEEGTAPAECGVQPQPISMMASDCDRSDAHNSATDCLMFSDRDVGENSSFVYSVYMCIGAADEDKDPDDEPDRDIGLGNSGRVTLNPGDLDENGEPFQCFTNMGSATAEASVAGHFMELTGDPNLKPPPAFAAKAINAEQIDLSWRAVPGIDYYRLYRLDLNAPQNAGVVKTAAGGDEIACGDFSGDGAGAAPAECGVQPQPLRMMASSDCFGRSDAHNSVAGCLMFSDNDVDVNSVFIYSVYMCSRVADAASDEASLKPGAKDENGEPFQCFTAEQSATGFVSVRQDFPQ